MQQYVIIFRNHLCLNCWRRGKSFSQQTFCALWESTLLCGVLSKNLTDPWAIADAVLWCSVLWRSSTLLRAAPNPLKWRVLATLKTSLMVLMTDSLTTQQPQVREWISLIPTCIDKYKEARKVSQMAFILMWQYVLEVVNWQNQKLYGANVKPLTPTGQGAEFSLHQGSVTLLPDFTTPHATQFTVCSTE